MAGIRAWIRDFLILYVCFWIIMVWAKRSVVPARLGILVLVLLLLTFIFVMERVGLIKRFF